MEAAAEGLDTRSGQDYPPAQRDQEPVSPGNTCCLPELGGKPAQGPQRHVVGGCVGGASGWVVGEEVVQEALNFFYFLSFLYCYCRHYSYFVYIVFSFCSFFFVIHAVIIFNHYPCCCLLVVSITSIGFQQTRCFFQDSKVLVNHLSPVLHITMLLKKNNQS